MSKIFFDHLIVLDEVDATIKDISSTHEEREELWHLVDDIVNHKVIITILDKLPIEHHHEFLTGFHEAPHDEKHLDFIKSVVEEDIEEVIKSEVEKLKHELLAEIKNLKKKGK